MKSSLNSLILLRIFLIKKNKPFFECVNIYHIRFLFSKKKKREPFFEPLNIIFKNIFFKKEKKKPFFQHLNTIICFLLEVKEK